MCDIPDPTERLATMRHRRLGRAVETVTLRLQELLLYIDLPTGATAKSSEVLVRIYLDFVETLAAARAIPMIRGPVSDALNGVMKGLKIDVSTSAADTEHFATAVHKMIRLEEFWKTTAALLNYQSQRGAPKKIAPPLIPPRRKIISRLTAEYTDSLER